MEHTEAHLERYLPIKQRDYAAWWNARMGDITSGTDGKTCYKFVSM